MPKENAYVNAPSFAALCAETPPATVTFDDLCIVSFDELCEQSTAPVIDQSVSFSDLCAQGTQDDTASEDSLTAIRYALEVLAAKTVIDTIEAFEKHDVQTLFDTLIDAGVYHDEFMAIIDWRDGDPAFERYFRNAMLKLGHAWPADAQEATFTVIKDVITSMHNDTTAPIAWLEKLYCNVNYDVWPDGHNVIFKPYSGLHSFGSMTLGWRNLFDDEEEGFAVDWDAERAEYMGRIKKNTGNWLETFRDRKNFIVPAVS